LNVSKELTRTLPKKLIELIKVIGREADKSNLAVFLVGGFVRDFLLGAANYDLDIVVEGDAIRFTEQLACKIQGRVVRHKKFGTGTIVMEWPKWLPRARGNFKIDIASAREETYRKPAALPTVKFSSLKEDLYRRDFTINAMAVSINKKNFGFFIDFFDGKKDLKKAVIRVLHDKSFIDDPTRIFRAVRFEQRFAFKIEKRTRQLIAQAARKDMFSLTQSQRVRSELILILKEEHPEKAIFRMRELHELRFIHRALSLRRDIPVTLNKLKKCVRWYKTICDPGKKTDVWLVYFMVMLEKLSSGEVSEVLEKFVFTRVESMKLKSYKALAEKVVKKISARKEIKPSGIYALLKPLSHEEILYVMAKVRNQQAINRIKKFFVKLDNVTLKIKGHDIKKEGVDYGPRYTELFHCLLQEKLNGKIVTKKDEIKYLRQIIARSKV